MKKNIYNKYDKTLISDLPVETFQGRIVVVLTEAEADKAVDYLLSSDILGFDTETRPSFKPGTHYKVCLLQVSTKEICFLFRLHFIGLCPSIIRLLEDNKVKKIGLSWHDDLRMLHQRGDFNAGEFVELQTLVKDVGIADLSLQKIYANLFHKKISKRQRLTNWEAPVLNDPQKVYAALDAQACISIYEEIERLKATQDYELTIVPEPEPPVKEEKPEQTKPIENQEQTEKKSKSYKPKRRYFKRHLSKKTEVKPEVKPEAKPKAKKTKPTTKKKKNDIQKDIPQEG